MRKLLLPMMMLLLVVVAAPAQENTKETPKEEAKAEKPAPKPLSGYKLEFVLRELQDGKVLNTRNYMMIMQDRYRQGELKIGSKVPIQTTEKDFQYLDVGTNVTCNRVEEQLPYLALECSVEISSFALPDQKLTSGVTSAPVLNQMRSNLPAMVEVGKPTVIGILDDPSSTRRYEIAVTATKVK